MMQQEAMRSLPYVECAADGKDTAAKTPACDALTGYPTWEIDGAQFPGERSFEEFESILELIENSRPGDATYQSQHLIKLLNMVWYIHCMILMFFSVPAGREDIWKSSIEGIGRGL